MKIEIHIARLVLDGLPVTSAQGDRVRRAMERELGRLFQNGAISSCPAGGEAVPELPAPRFRFGRRDSPSAIGKQIATSVHAGLSRMR
jgi:hypothetical protein